MTAGATFRGGDLTVMEGKDGFLFVDRFEDIDVKRLLTDPATLPETTLASWADTLRRRRAYFEEHGIVDVLFVIPDSYLVYEDKLPPEIVVSRPTPYERLQAVLDAPDRARCVYPRDLLVDGRKTEETFQPVDSHWTDWGAYLGYRSVMAALAKRLPGVRVLDAEDIEWTTRLTFGALGAVANPERSASVPIGHVRNSRVRIVADLMTEVRDGYKVTEQDNPDLPTAVVFRDSFMTQAGPFLSESFRRTVYASSRNTIHYDLIEREHPDVVIHELGERSLYKAPHEPSTVDFRFTFGDLLLGDPDAVAEQRRSRTLLNSGRNLEALIASDRVMALVPPNARLMVHRGRIHLALGRTNAAVEALRQAIILDPTDGYASYRLAQALRQAGRNAEALSAIDLALAAEPRQSAFWTEAIIIALAVPDLERARSLAQQAIGRFPDSAQLHYASSCVHLAAGRIEDAEAAARAALAGSPANSAFAGQLASVLNRQARWSEALDILSALDPDEPGVADAIAHLNSQRALTRSEM